MAGNPILNAAYKSAADTSAVIDNSSDAIIQTRGQQQDLADETAQIQTQQGVYDALMISTTRSAQLETQLASAKAGAAFGADMRLQSEVITQNAQTAEAAYRRKMDVSDQLTANSSVQFMDNPLQYIINTFSHNGLVDQYYNAERVENDAYSHIQAVNTASQATATNQKNFEVSLSQASIAAETDKTKAAAQVAANSTKIQALGFNVDALQTSINASKEQTALKFQTLAAQNAQAQLGIAMQHLDMAREKFNWEKEQKANATATDDFFVNRIQAGLKVMYGDKAPDLTASPKVAAQWLALLKSNSPAGKEATDAYMAGQSGVLGGSAASVIDSMHNGIQFQFTPVQEPIKKIFDSAVQSTAAGVQAGTVTKANYQEVMNGEVKKQVDGYLKNIDPNVAGNPFNIPSTSQIIQMPGVKDTPFTQKILAPGVASGAQMNDPSLVYSMAIKGVTDGTISLADATDGIVAFYQKGVDVNLVSRNLTKFGIVPTENMHSYNTKVETDPTALWGRSQTVDLTNKNAVTRALNKSLASQQRFELNTLVGTGGLTQ